MPGESEPGNPAEPELEATVPDAASAPVTATDGYHHASMLALDHAKTVLTPTAEPATAYTAADMDGYMYHTAAMRIQAWIRGSRTRRTAAVQEREEEREGSAVLIQSAWRDYQAHIDHKLGAGFDDDLARLQALLDDTAPRQQLHSAIRAVSPLELSPTRLSPVARPRRASEESTSGTSAAHRQDPVRLSSSSSSSSSSSEQEEEEEEEEMAEDDDDDDDEAVGGAGLCTVLVYETEGEPSEPVDMGEWAALLRGGAVGDDTLVWSEEAQFPHEGWTAWSTCSGCFVAVDRFEALCDSFTYIKGDGETTEDATVADLPRLVAEGVVTPETQVFSTEEPFPFDTWTAFSECRRVFGA